MKKVFDCVIVGGGPAGLSAGIYLGRFNRSVLVVDKGNGGRWHSHEINENYLGFPSGIASKELRALGKRQAQKFGAEFCLDEISNVRKRKSGFVLSGKKNYYYSKTIIFATGVADNFPPIKNIDQYIGECLFWCITCDGYKVRNKRVVVLGNNEEAACMTMQLLNFTKKITYLSNSTSKESGLSDIWRARLRKTGVNFIEGYATDIIERNKGLKHLLLHDGEKLPADFIFSVQGAMPHSQLAKKLGVELSREDYIKTDIEQRTNVTGVYAAGDVTKYFSHQIASAVHEGSMAAQAVNYDLYRPEQKVVS